MREWQSRTIELGFLRSGSSRKTCPLRSIDEEGMSLVKFDIPPDQRGASVFLSTPDALPAVNEPVASGFNKCYLCPWTFKVKTYPLFPERVTTK